MKLHLSFAFALLLSILVFEDSECRILYVPDDYESVEAAVENAEDDDTVSISAGRYEASLGDLERPARITIIGTPNLQTTLAGSDRRENLFTAWDICVNLNDLVFSNFESLEYVDNAGGEIKNCIFASDVAVPINAGRGTLMIASCTFVENIVGVSTSGNTRIYRCVFRGSSRAIEIFLNESENRIINNVFYACGDGIAMFYLQGRPVPSIVENNVFVQNEYALSIGDEEHPNAVAGNFMNFNYNLLWQNESDFMRFHIVIDEVVYWEEIGEFEPQAGDGLIFENPLFQDADENDFRLRPNSPCIDTGNPESPEDPDGSRADMGVTPFHQLSEHHIMLQGGWNLLSAICLPRDANIPIVWSDLVRQNHLAITKNQSGQFYLPERQFNNMPPWDVRQGYQAKLNEPDTLVISGIQVSPETSIPLRRGWNIVAYFPAGDIPAQDAFANIAERLEMAKDGEGRFYRPANRFSNMGNLTRGRGYQVKVTDDCELVWNDPNERMVGLTSEHISPQERFFTVKTDRNMSVLIDCPDLGIEEIGVITSDGICVGAARAIRGKPIGLAVWGDDPTTAEKDGALVGDSLMIRVWMHNKELDFSAEWLVEDGIYDPDGFAQVILTTSGPQFPSDFILSDPYPNPFNSSTAIVYSLPNNAAIKIGVYDLAGKEVAVVFDGVHQAGTYSSVWQADNVPSGIYICRLNAGDRTQSVKLLLVR